MKLSPGIYFPKQIKTPREESLVFFIEDEIVSKYLLWDYTKAP
jgi:hypothetical protein